MPDRKKLEKELSALLQTNNFGKILFCFKRKFEAWSLYNLSQEGLPKIKIAYMPFLMNIGIEGTTNNQLASILNVTKQAMSKTLMELDGLNLIEFKPNPADARSSLIRLTLHGMKVVILCRKKVNKLSEKYIEILGQKKYSDMLDSLSKLSDFHAVYEKEHMPKKVNN